MRVNAIAGVTQTFYVDRPQSAAIIRDNLERLAVIQNVKVEDMIAAARSASTPDVTQTRIINMSDRLTKLENVS